jgi:hypothetical protein
MPSNKLLAVPLISLIFLCGCHADAGDAKSDLSTGIPKIDAPKKDAPFSAPATPAAAPAALPGNDKEKEIVDMSLG